MDHSFIFDKLRKMENFPFFLLKVLFFKTKLLIFDQNFDLNAFSNLTIFRKKTENLILGVFFLPLTHDKGFSVSVIFGFISVVFKNTRFLTRCKKCLRNVIFESGREMAHLFHPIRPFINYLDFLWPKIPIAQGILYTVPNFNKIFRILNNYLHKNFVKKRRLWHMLLLS